MIQKKAETPGIGEENKYISKARSRFLMENIPYSILANAILALLLFLILRNDVPLKRIAVTAGTIYFILVMRGITFVLFKKDKPFLHVKIWRISYITGIGLTTFAWSMTSWYSFPVDSPISQFYLVLILSGMISGSLLSLSSEFWILISYVQLLLIPLILRNILLPQAHSTELITMMIVFDLFISGTSWNHHMRLLRFFRLEYSQKNALRKLNLSEQKFYQIFHEAPSGIYYYNEDLIIEEANNGLADILNYPLEKLKGFDLRAVRDLRLIPTLEKVFDGESGFYEGEYNLTTSEGKRIISLHTSPMEDTSGNIIGGIGIVQDITEKTMIQKEIEYQAYHDTLTGLPNRQLLMDRLSQALKSTRRHKHKGVLFYLDLDKFKLINDSMGHQIGDKLLIEVADRLTEVLRQEDTVARMGGDEFVILLPEVTDDKESSVIVAGMVSEKIHQTLSDPFDLDSHRIRTSTSIGAIIFDGQEESPDQVLKFADTAMYHAKDQGRSRTSFFHKEMDAILQEQMSLEKDLSEALKSETLEIYIQPIVRIDRKRICGAEALLRWFHPEKGFINPEKIIHTAEKSGQIIPLGKWIMKRSLEIYRELKNRDGCELDYISINLSVNQILQQNFVRETLALLEESEIPFERIILEITENIFIRDFENTISKMQELRDRGVQFALDDFGTGYSSLSYLKKLPLDKLKIDKSFTENLMSDRSSFALVETIMKIAEQFGLQVITEGVEEKEQIDALEGMECSFYQGYYCSKPLKPEDFARFAEEFNRRNS